MAKKTWNPDGSMIIDDSDMLKNNLHICNKEGVLAMLTTNISDIKTGQDDIKSGVKEINGQYMELLIDITKVKGSINTVEDKIQEIKDKEDQSFSKRTKIITIVLSCIVVAIALWGVYKELANIGTKIDHQEGISKTTRSGYVIYNDNGLIDSTKIR